MCKLCINHKIKYLTVYAFSIENWKRPENEINNIFKILNNFFKKNKNFFIKEKIKTLIIGEKKRFDENMLSNFRAIEKHDFDNPSLYLQVAFGYGGRNEIVRTTIKLVKKVLKKKIELDEITEKTFQNHLDTKSIPDVDLIIRTGGSQNQRLSNFLPWQSVYAELFFSSLLWPEFSETEFEKAIKFYKSAERKMGQ